MKTITCRLLPLILALLTLTLAITACGGVSGGYAFKTGGATVAIGDKADDALAVLGTAISQNESPSCGGIPGNDCVYTYTGFRIKTTPANGGYNVVCQIELTDDSVKTPEGVYIGMTAEDAKAAMSGNGTPEMVGETMVYAKGNMKLQIICRGGSVTGILYIAA